MSDRWDALVERLTDIADLTQAAALMHWDQAVNLPPKGGEGRARALATITGLYHERLVDPAIGELIDELSDDETLEEYQTASIRNLRRAYDKATKVPEKLVRALTEATGISYQVWTEARPDSDYDKLKPYLVRVFELKKEVADAQGWEIERYDALLDDYEPHIKASEVKSMFDELVEGLRPLADRVLGSAPPKPAWLSAEQDKDVQLKFCIWLAERLNYDFDSGRVDESPHPFTIHIGREDIRQTTRTQNTTLMSSIYALIHETGHALYDQGVPSEWDDLPVGGQPSLGMHESQSRMWENQVGRSRAFAEWVLPHMKEKFPHDLGTLTPDEFFKGINYPERTMIRVEADELTYNLHVALRFEIELAIYRDELTVEDLPDAWNEKMEAYLGIRPANHSEGVLQDMHWTIGHHGYFPTYTLGNLYAAAFYAKAEEQAGPFESDIRKGDFAGLLTWLRENIHQHGYLYETKDLAARILDEPISAKPLIAYLTSKYDGLF